MIEPSIKKNIISQWFKWHYFEVSKEILTGFSNYLVFLFNYFSIAQLSKTFFSHWRRYREFYPKGFDPKLYLKIFTGNMISRVLGAIIRLFTILIGLVSESIALVFGILIFLIWVFSPLIIFFLFLFGFELLFF